MVHYDLNKIDRDNALERDFGIRVVRSEGEYLDLDRIDRENALRRFMGDKYHEGMLDILEQKTVSERILEALIKSGPLSLDALIEKLPHYAYCMKPSMNVEVNAGHVREIKENVYEITEKGRQSITYGFEKKFFKLNKHR